MELGLRLSSCIKHTLLSLNLRTSFLQSPVLMNMLHFPLVYWYTNNLLQTPVKAIIIGLFLEKILALGIR
ncbi:hypothetical protein JCM15765_24910 [Paradesulfitobacterium aromaticivorans]